MHCSNSNKALIRFKPPEEDWDIFETNFPPVEVSVEETSNIPSWGHTCEDILYQIDFQLRGGFFASNPLRFNPGPRDIGYNCNNVTHTDENANNITRVWGEIRGFRVTEFRDRGGGSTRRFCNRGTRPSGRLQGYSSFEVLCRGPGPNSPPTADYIWHSLWADGRTAGHYLGDQWTATAIPTSTTFRNRTVNCIFTPQCLFQISDTRGVVYERMFDTCPEYEIDCGDNNCPPGTCEVMCKDRVCCYDTQGISVFSFMK